MWKKGLYRVLSPEQQEQPISEV